ncbi:MAG: SDR family oxidoreductase [Candidatus Hydrogenedentes bacterium]|nr:SDR family oxidoreductase [Candidatus Hydrogenedentota bacterium]
MTLLLENQVAIITGAGRGIGAATAKLFASQGARVVVSDLDLAPAEEVVAAIKDAGGDALAVAGDVTDPAFPENVVKAAMDTYGKLNVLVNNAGYTWDGMLHKMSDKQFMAMLEVHNVAPFRMARAAAPFMRDAAKAERKEGKPPEPRCIVNVSSIAGLNGNTGQVNYSTAKSGVAGMTKTIAKEWGAFGIRCNAVAFGMIETRLTQDQEAGEKISMEGEEVQLGIPGHMKGLINMLIPMGRAGTPDEAAGAILMLASPYASYVTGHILEVTGGL